MPNILIVDDSPSIRQTLQICLGDAGHRITQAENGAAGLARAKSERFDLVITDLNMPEMDGLSMIRALRQEATYAGVPILFLSTESDVGIKQQARTAGATGWVTKPFQPDQLIQIVSKVLSR